MKKQNRIHSLRNSPLTEEVFDQIYLENFDHLFLFAKSMTKSEDISKDIVSEVFLNLWKNREKFSEIREIESYLFISIKNQSIRILNNDYAKKVSFGFENTMRMIDKVDPEDLLMEKELSMEIEKVISSLPPKCQMIFRMAKEKHLKYHEIADNMGISVASVKTQLVKAMAQLKKAIIRKYGDDDDTDLNSLAQGS